MNRLPRCCRPMSLVVSHWPVARKSWVFIHGYSASFHGAALATGEICRSLQNQFVCIVLTWPAGGSGGMLFGYNIDRESSEFAVADLKKAVRIIAEARGVERLHLLAHSRGTDLLANVAQQLAIEAYVSRSSRWDATRSQTRCFSLPISISTLLLPRCLRGYRIRTSFSAANQGQARSRLKALCISRFIRLRGTKR